MRGRKAPAPLVPPRPTEVKRIWGTPQGGASWAAPPSHRAQLLPAWMEQQSDTTPAAKTKGKAKTQKVDPSPQITRSPRKKKENKNPNPWGMCKRRGTQRCWSPTSESAPFGHSQTASEDLSQPKRVSQRLPKKREKNKQSRDRAVGFFPSFLPQTKQKKDCTQPSH